MRYEDVLNEASKYGVQIFLSFGGGCINFEGIQHAHMVKLMGRKWGGYTKDSKGEDMVFHSTKGRVANWCLDYAANGPFR